MYNIARAVLAAFALLATLLVAPPASAHGGAPVAENDVVKVRAGKQKVVRVLRNDSVRHKRVARIKIKRAPRTLRASVVDDKKIRIRPRKKAVGKYRIVYVVIDKHGRRDRARVRVKVRPHRKSLIVRTRRLDVASETRGGYERSKFPHWTDANGDCQDTRSEVLRRESTVAVSGACTVRSGRWRSRFDGEVWTSASDVDIDHLVPLAEAWDSGAKRWTRGTRKRFANDLGDRRTLTAMTDNLNQSKSDRDPAQWLPPRKRCKYVTHWVATKVRWRLTVNRAEKDTLLRYAKSCRHRIVRVKRAGVALRDGSGGSGGGSTTGGLAITRVVYNPDGDERYAPNAEKVYVKNVSGSKKNLQGVRLTDANGYHRFTMPSYGLAAGSTVIVHAGSGANGGGHLYAGWDTAVWNNSGDTASLRAAGGSLIHQCSWAGGGTTAWC